MAILGELETQIMEILWGAGKQWSVRSVHEELLNKRPLAYTTVMTVLDRLAKKGIVQRELDGRAWLYVAGSSRAQLVGGALTDVVAEARDEEREVFTLFAQSLTQQQRPQRRAALDEVTD